VRAGSIGLPECAGKNLRCQHPRLKATLLRCASPRLPRLPGRVAVVHLNHCNRFWGLRLFIKPHGEQRGRAHSSAPYLACV
jgi:hypothetical protein